MLDTVFSADAIEDMADPATTVALVAVGKLHAIIGEDGLDFIRYRFNQNPQEGCCGQLGCLAVDSGEPAAL